MTIRALCLSLGIAAASAAPAAAYVETELNYVTTPLAERVSQRLAPLAAARYRTSAEERELRALTQVWLRIREPSETLRDEFRELEAAAAGLRGIPDESGVFGGALTTALERADEQIAFRRAWVEDHVAVLPEGRRRRAVERLLADAAKLETRAAAQPRADRRATLLRRTEKLLTAALVAADAVAERFDVERPPPRVRNGSIVGAAGGRIVVPEDGSPLAGVDVTLPPGSVGGTMRFLVETVDWSLEWPEVLVAPALRIGQGEPYTELPRPLVVSFRHDPAHVGDPTLAVTHGWSGAAPLAGAVFGDDGRVTVELPSFGMVVARRILPPPEHPAFPAERYHVVLAYGRATSATAGAAESLDGVAEQDFTFGPGPTGSTADGTLSAVERRYVAEAPRHDDSTRTATLPGGAISWSLRALSPAFSRSEYTISFPLDGDVLTGDGVLSRDGAVTVFTARGVSTVAIGFGLRDDAAASAADLDEPWFLGVQDVALEGSGSADFAVRRSAGIAGLVPDGAGGLVAAGGESVFTVSVRIRAHMFPAGFSETLEWVAPEGLAGASLASDGRLTADGGLTTGWVHSSAGILVARRFDAATGSSRLLLGVRDDGGDCEELFPIMHDGIGGGYWSRALAKSARVFGLGSPAARIFSSWTTLRTFWRRHPTSSAFIDGYSWTLDWSTLEVESDAAAWMVDAQTGSGSASPHPVEDSLYGGSLGTRSPRRGSKAGYGFSVAVSRDGEALLVHSNGSVGLGVRQRE